MYSANGFNVCPHCGKANALNARFCACCGKQLTVPDEVVVCPKCRKPNSPAATFCGHCGAPLKEGMPTKICPRCGKAVSVSDNICSCGYNFGAAVYAEKGASAKAKRPYGGGRIIACVALIFLLAFAYFVAAPASIRPTMLSRWDCGVLANGSRVLYASDLLGGAVSALVNGGIASLADSVGIGGIAVIVICALAELCMAFHFVTCVVRIFTAKRSKHSNGFYLTLAILTTLWTLVWAVCKYLIPTDSAAWLLSVRNAFVPYFEIGIAYFAIPLYFWFFFIYSACAKVRTLHEQMLWQA